MRLRRSKYGAEPTTVDGIRFASKKESVRYQELKLLERAGTIRDLHLQPVFQLHACRSGKLLPLLVGHYIGDFAYQEQRENGWALVIEDVKGVKTDLYLWKRKHLHLEYGISIREI